MAAACVTACGRAFGGPAALADALTPAEPLARRVAKPEAGRWATLSHESPSGCKRVAAAATPALGEPLAPRDCTGVHGAAQPRALVCTAAVQKRVKRKRPAAPFNQDVWRAACLSTPEGRAREAAELEPLASKSQLARAGKAARIAAAREQFSSNGVHAAERAYKRMMRDRE